MCNGWGIHRYGRFSHKCRRAGIADGAVAGVPELDVVLVFMETYVVLY